MTKDDLEEQGLYEVCNHCNSPALKQLDNDNIYCTGCGTVNFTKVITEEELETELKRGENLKA